ncbi:MAG: hypothetical protein ACI9ME_001804, partial [Ilumatobacter sp.]
GDLLVFHGLVGPLAFSFISSHSGQTIPAADSASSNAPSNFFGEFCGEFRRPFAADQASITIDPNVQTPDASARPGALLRLTAASSIVRSSHLNWLRSPHRQRRLDARTRLTGDNLRHVDCGGPRVGRRGPPGRGNRCSDCRAVRNLFEKFLKSNVQHADLSKIPRWQRLMVLCSAAAVGSPEDLVRAR